METVLQLLVPAGLALMMLGMGLTLTPADFARAWQSPRAVLGGLAAQLVMLPLVAFAVAKGLSLDGPLAVGLLLLAACPGGPTSNLLTSMAGGDVALSIILTAVSGMVTVVTIPLVVNLGLGAFLGTSSAVQLPVLATIAQILIVTLVPVSLGMLLLARRPAIAARLEPVLRRMAALFVALLVAGVVLKERERLVGYVAAAGAAVLALNLCAMALGAGVAAVLRLGRARTVTITIEVGMQNAAMAISIALGLLHRPDMAVPAGLYACLMYLSCGAVVWFALRGSGSHAGTRAVPEQ